MHQMWPIAIDITCNVVFVLSVLVTVAFWGLFMNLSLNFQLELVMTTCVGKRKDVRVI